jgi:hypothetical protein
MNAIPGEQGLDAMPEKVYYVPLPRPRLLRRLGLPPLPRLHMPDLALSATIDNGWRRWCRGRSVAAAWWASHTPDAVWWTLATASAVVVGVVVARI